MFLPRCFSDQGTPCVSVSNPFRTRGTALQRFAEMIKIIFKSAPATGANHLGDEGVALLECEASRHYRVNISEEENKRQSRDVWKNDKGKSLKTSMCAYCLASS